MIPNKQRTKTEEGTQLEKSQAEDQERQRLGLVD